MPALEWLARILAAIGGYVDAVGYIALYRLFTAHQSGNSAGLGVALSGGDWTTASRRATAIGAYVVGIGVGTVVVEVTRRWKPRWSGSAVALCELAALGAALGVGVGWAIDGRIPLALTAPYAADAATLASAMGLQTVVLRRVGGVTVRTTFVTGVLANMAEAFVVALFTRQRDLFRFSGLLGSMWLAYLGGAVVGGLADRAWAFPALALPMAAIAILAAWLAVTCYEPTLPSKGIAE